MKPITPDVLVCNEGTVFVFCPLTPRAQQWMEENVSTEPWQWFGNALVVDQRYARALGEVMKDEGLRLTYGNAPIEGLQLKRERTKYEQAIDRACEAQAEAAARHGGKKKTRAEVEQFILTVVMLAATDESKDSSHEN